MPKTSVIIAAFNARAFIHEGIESVLAQTDPDWELIVVDDASTDGTADFVETSYKHEPRIKVMRLEKNGGPGKARNIGIAAACGDWVAILDSDDKFTPERIATLRQIAEEDELDLIADNQLLYDETANIITSEGFLLGKPRTPITIAMLIKNDMGYSRFFLGLLKPFFRRKFAEEKNIRYPEDIRVGEDFMFLFHLLYSGAKTTLLREAYYVYTTPSGLASKVLSTKTRSPQELAAIHETLKGNTALLRAVEQDKAKNNKKIIDLLKLREEQITCCIAYEKRTGKTKLQRHMQTLRNTFLIKGYWYYMLNLILNYRFHKTHHIILR